MNGNRGVTVVNDSLQMKMWNKEHRLINKEGHPWINHGTLTGAIRYFAYCLEKIIISLR